MRIMINDPDGRLSGIVVGDTFGVDYDKYFKFKGLDGMSGRDTSSALSAALESIKAHPDPEYPKLSEKITMILSSLLDMASKMPDGTWMVR